MKKLRTTLLCIAIFLMLAPAFSQETSKPKVLSGFSGGMMLHTGYLDGRLPQVGYRTKGAPFGLGVNTVVPGCGEPSRQTRMSPRAQSALS